MTDSYWTPEVAFGPRGLEMVVMVGSRREVWRLVRRPTCVEIRMPSGQVRMVSHDVARALWERRER